jgi:hypothetical protein
MIKSVFFVGVAAALSIAMLPAKVSAKGFGGHAHLHFFGHGLHRGHFGGYVLGAWAIVAAQPLPVGAASMPAPRCQHSREVVTVPSEEGGTRQITIIRC